MASFTTLSRCFVAATLTLFAAAPAAGGPIRLGVSAHVSVATGHLYDLTTLANGSETFDLKPLVPEYVRLYEVRDVPAHRLEAPETTVYDAVTARVTLTDTATGLSTLLTSFQSRTQHWDYTPMLGWTLSRDTQRQGAHNGTGFGMPAEPLVKRVELGENIYTVEASGPWLVVRAETPEPGSLAAAAAGLTALGLIRLRRGK